MKRKRILFLIALAALAMFAVNGVAAQAGAGESPVPTPEPPGPVEPTGDPLTDNIVLASVVIVAIAGVALVVLDFLPKGIGDLPSTELKSAAEIAAGAAEQMAKIGEIAPEDRLEYALAVAEDTLKAAGYKIDIDEAWVAVVIRRAVEAAVARL